MAFLSTHLIVCTNRAVSITKVAGIEGLDIKYGNKNGKEY